jgi:hypothetical protein
MKSTSFHNVDMKKKYEKTPNEKNIFILISLIF